MNGKPTKQTKRVSWSESSEPMLQHFDAVLPREDLPWDAQKKAAKKIVKHIYPSVSKFCETFRELSNNDKRKILLGLNAIILSYGTIDRNDKNRIIDLLDYADPEFSRHIAVACAKLQKNDGETWQGLKHLTIRPHNLRGHPRQRYTEFGKCLVYIEKNYDGLDGTICEHLNKEPRTKKILDNFIGQNHKELIEKLTYPEVFFYCTLDELKNLVRSCNPDELEKVLNDPSHRYMSFYHLQEIAEYQQSGQNDEENDLIVTAKTFVIAQMLRPFQRVVSEGSFEEDIIEAGEEIIKSIAGFKGAIECFCNTFPDLSEGKKRIILAGIDRMLRSPFEDSIEKRTMISFLEDNAQFRKCIVSACATLLKEEGETWKGLSSIRRPSSMFSFYNKSYTRFGEDLVKIEIEEGKKQGHSWVNGCICESLNGEPNTSFPSKTRQYIREYRKYREYEKKERNIELPTINP